jgi:hypothetical protein
MKKLILSLLVAVGLIGSASAALVIQTFNYTGSYQSFIVPTGVNSILFDLVGASSGEGSGHWEPGTDGQVVPSLAEALNGISGFEITGSLSVISGETLNVFVGGAGGNDSSNFGNSAAGFNYIDRSQTNSISNSVVPVIPNIPSIPNITSNILVSEIATTPLIGLSGLLGGGTPPHFVISSGGFGGETDIRINGTNSTAIVAFASGGTGNSDAWTPYTSPVNGYATISYNAVPEPSTYALFGIGTIGLLMVLRRKKTA